MKHLKFEASAQRSCHAIQVMDSLDFGLFTARPRICELIYQSVPAAGTYGAVASNCKAWGSGHRVRKLRGSCAQPGSSLVRQDW